MTKKRPNTVLRIIFPILFVVCIWLFFIVESDEKPIYILNIPITGNNYWGVICCCLLIGFWCWSYFKFGEYDVINTKDKVIKYIGITGFTCAILLFTIPLFVLPIIAGSYTFVVNTYLNNVWLFYLLVFSFGFALISYLIVQYLLRFTEHYQHIATCRIISLSSLFIFTILFVISSCLNVFNTIGSSNELSGYGIFIIAVFSIGIGRTLFEDFHFLIYDKKHYLLYLRSFTFDKDEHYVSESLETAGLPILKIGNPKTFFPRGIGDVFYLPSANWKKQLNYYIERAEIIFSVVDVTDGVLWEMFEHLDQAQKFVYHISNKDYLKIILRKVPKEEYRNSFLMECFETILYNDTIQKCSFLIREGNCHYGDSQTILKLMSNQIPKEGVPYFIIRTYSEVPQSKNSEEQDYYKSLDAASLFIRIIKKVITFVSKTITFLLGKTFVLLSWSFALVLILTPLAVLIFDSNSFDWCGSLFCLILGIIIILYIKSNN